MTRAENQVLDAMVEIRDSSLTRNAKLIAYALLSYSSEGNAVPFPKISELATMVGVCKRETRIALEVMVAEGFLPAARLRDFRDERERWHDELAGGRSATT